MTLSDILKDAGWYFQHRDLIKQVLGNSEVLALIEAVKELGDGSPAEPGTLHDKLAKAGVDTKKLAEEIHPAGPQQGSSGNPDAGNAGSNNAGGP